MKRWPTHPAEGDGEKIIEHIDHAVKVAGADHVGLGSDFRRRDHAARDGGPIEAAEYPTRCSEGYSDQDVEKIRGGNILRVMEQVEKVLAPARRLEPTPE